MWFYSITLRGYGARDKTTLTFQLDTIGDPLADHVAAQNAAAQIRGALLDVTDALPVQEKLTDLFFEDNTRPPADVDVYEEAAISCYLNPPNAAEKLHTLRIPAPIDALFMADGETVDASNSLLIQYVQQVAQHAYVSDEEKIDTTADNGIKYGYKRTKARRFN